jgi:hypothetical protein
VVILIEIKLTERGFTHCAGRTSRRNQRTDVCETATKLLDDTNGCYLTRPVRATRDRRYWTIFQQAHGSLSAAFPGLRWTGACPFADDMQQPMRQLAMARGLEQAGLDDEAWNGLIHHDDNPDVPGPWDTLSAASSTHRLFRTPASALLKFSPTHHGAWMRSRYRLPPAP